MNETIYEVEQKFQISDSPKLEAQLLGIGAAPFLQIEQVDTYFAHPARDFGQTDEAFRLRRIGEKNYVTYKGPKIDATTKTRQEMERVASPKTFLRSDFQYASCPRRAQ